MDKASVFQNLGKRLFKILAKDCSKSWQKIVQIHQKNLGMGQTSPFWAVPRLQQLFCTLWILKLKFTRKILAWVGPSPPRPFLAMPGFWKRLAFQPLPNNPSPAFVPHHFELTICWPTFAFSALAVSQILIMQDWHASILTVRRYQIQMQNDTEFKHNR